MTTESFYAWMNRIASGDQNAAREVFDRYAGRLMALAATKLCPMLRRKEDPEDVVQSTLKSFFQRHADGKFDLPDEGSLWGLLAEITARKCANRARKYETAQRNMAIEESFQSSSVVGDWQFVDREPGPEDELVLAETTKRLMESLREKDRLIFQHLSLSRTPAEIKQLTGFSLATISRARRHIREWLESELGAECSQA